MVQLRRDPEDYQDEETDTRTVEVFEFILERSLAEFEVAKDARSAFARIACRVLGDRTLLDVPQRDTRYKLLRKISMRDTSCIPVAEKFLEQIVHDAFPEKFFAVARQDEQPQLLRMLHLLGAGDAEVLEHQLSIYDWMNDRVQDIVRRMRVVGMDNARFQQVCGVSDNKLVANTEGAGDLFQSASDSKELFEECRGILDAILDLILPRIGRNRKQVMGQLYLDGTKKLQFRENCICIDGVNIGWLASELLARYIAFYRPVEILAAKHLELDQTTRELLAEKLVIDGNRGIKQVKSIESDEFDSSIEWLGKRIFTTLLENQSLLAHDFLDISMVMDDEALEIEPSAALTFSTLEELFPRKRPLLFTEGLDIELNDEDKAMVQSLELEAMC